MGDRGELVKQSSGHVPVIDWFGAIGILFLLGALAAMLARCHVQPPDDPHAFDAGPPDPPPPPGVDWCVEACRNFARLGCREADPTPGEDGRLGTADDGLCVNVCWTAEEQPETTLHPACVSIARTCDEARECTR